MCSWWCQPQLVKPVTLICRRPSLKCHSTGLGRRARRHAASLQCRGKWARRPTTGPPFETNSCECLEKVPACLRQITQGLSMSHCRWWLDWLAQFPPRLTTGVLLYLLLDWDCADVCIPTHTNVLSDMAFGLWQPVPHENRWSQWDQCVTRSPVGLKTDTYIHTQTHCATGDFLSEEVRGVGSYSGDESDVFNGLHWPFHSTSLQKRSMYE